MIIAYIKYEKLVRKIFPVIKIRNWDNNYIITISDTNKNIIQKRLVQYIIKRKIEVLVFSKELEGEYKEKILERLEQKEHGRIKLATGRSLMEYMETDLVQYILKEQGSVMEQEEIYVLVKKADDLKMDSIYKLIENFRMVNIVTSDIRPMKILQSKLQEKEDILISVSNNKRKALKRAKYILNINLDKQEIMKYNINRNSIIINIQKEVKYDSSNFDGINVNYFQISCPDEIVEKFEQIGGNFDLVKLYESVLLHDNIQKRKLHDVCERIKKDGIKITQIIGNNGEILPEELQKIHKMNLDKMKKVV